MHKLPLSEGTIILDTETTGLGPDDEIIEIAIINGLGDVLINTQIKPVNLIPEEATAIHGITNDLVRNKRPWSDYIGDIEHLLNKADALITYNLEFDLRMIAQTSALCKQQFILSDAKPHCAMRWYAEFYKKRQIYQKDFKTQKLINAVKQQGIDSSQFKAHSALGDCQMTLELIRTVNEKLK